MTFVYPNAGADGMAAFFPTLEGWTPKGEVELYTPDNLYEYIDGAADIFLAFDFQKLAALTYENNNKQTFTVDIYRHSNDINGFGIYSQEKPRQGSFLAIGTQGYYESGILNFLKGSYYVKMSGFDLGETDEKVLTAAAQKVAAALDGPVQFPAVVDCFPVNAKIPNSEAYTNRNFLGHSFLHSAFTAEYDANGQKFQVFIIQTAEPQGAADILNKYLTFVKGKGIPVEENNNYYRFQDPYYRSSGMMNMKIEKNVLWGLFSKDAPTAEAMIKEIEKNLKENKLI